ncbi:peptide/nickel transport system substrate-binding protein [Rhodopseudomonas thermotolerans]|uniref:Peptide/nickel transport system substrate-binding protein n=2 Tax=Rhodopseudomonas TaxID=1073 RepID=A0A336JW28_9BRAD|nr:MULTISPECIES: ABC transporter substrate-binding protein [Rhodopseudomonas]RED21542.1 peptide/nickel transport system substrate-binding protein [Rhodopseudomonas pentothenatexigens]REF86912.1 peptide/nickel transport system substrate-binding protein [Rhodopseudomonas thermotolerans]SSW93662.1 peptide/nickel transport system substrate-binding protein [Rhodopseudomonas pentothenatexigens]
MKLTKRSFLAGAIGGAALIGLPFEFTARAAEGGSGGTLVIGSTQVPRHFNGAVQSGIATALPSTQIYASPLRYDDNWNPQPYLAESWEVSKDGLTVTLKLVKNATFHDGKPVTSEDVAFSIMTIKANHPFKTMLAAVESVDTPDPHTAVIKLAHPHPALLLAMSPALMPILPKHVYGDGQDVKSHPANLKPIGSGPYKLAEYKQGDYYTLEKFDKFFIPGRPKLDKIVVRLISDPSALMVSVERGDIHAVPYFTGVRDIERLEKAPNVVVTDKGFAGLGALNWLAFNTKKQPLDDARVRQAIGYAANRDFIVKKLMGGKAMPSTGPIAPGSPLEEKAVEQYKFDVAKANKLLDEAGLKPDGNGVRTSLTIDYIPGNDEQQRNVAEYLRSALKRVGINLEVRAAPDFPTWAQRVANFDFDLTMDTVFNWGDPVIGVDRTYLSSNIRKGIIWSNTQQYSNPKVDGILGQAAKETSPEKRKALYSEFQKIVVQDAPIFYINATPYHSAFAKGLASLPTTIWGVASPLDELHWATPPKN